MNIIITGASGYVGSILIPELLKYNHNLLLVGRNTDKLKSKYINISICEYHELSRIGKNFDLLINLAAINNNSKKQYSYYLKVNRDFLYKLAEMSKSAKIKYFLNISSFHELDIENQSKYAKSKREGTKKIQNISGLKILNIYIPFVYGKIWPKKIKILNFFPYKISQICFYFIASFYPTLNIKKLAKFINKNLSSYKKKNNYLFDSKNDNYFYVVITLLVNIFISFSILLSFSWLMILIYIFVSFTGKGKPIFIQKRVGQHKKHFDLFKFRTMQINTKELATHLINKNKVTKLGKILRVLKFDELPQIINLLMNKVTFVGPRPSLISQKNLIKIREENNILELKPGLTGYAQVNHIDMSNIKRLVQYDHYYLINRSLVLDFKIIIKTFLGIGFRDNVSK